MKEPQVRFDLVENAFDYLVEAALCVAKGEQRYFKYSLLHLAAAVELFLKARLAKEHWSLVFVDPEKANIADLATGAFQSVGIDKAQARLAAIAGVRLLPEDKRSIERLVNHRNRVQHFAIEITADAIKAILAKGYGFVLRFCHQHLHKECEKYGAEMDTAYQELGTFNEFVAARMAQIEGELKVAPELTVCGRCEQDTRVIGTGERVSCLFCGYEITAADEAELWDFGEIEHCPTCNAKAYVLVADSPDRGREWKCIACGVTGGDRGLS